MNDSIRVTNMPDPGSKEAVAFKLWQSLRDHKATPEAQLKFFVTCLNATFGNPP